MLVKNFAGVRGPRFAHLFTKVALVRYIFAMLTSWLRVLKKDLTPEQIKKIKFDLTYKIANNFLDSKLVKLDFGYKEEDNDDYLYLPRFKGKEWFPNYEDLTWEGVDVTCFHSFNLEFNEEVKKQESAFAALTRDLQKHQSAIISLPPGDGKTEVALKALQDIKKKTLVLAHADYICQQWIDRAKARYPTVKTAYLMQKLTKKKEAAVRAADLVAGTVQSMCMCDYPKNLLEDFGVVILDEVHHYGSPEWRKAFHLLEAKYWIGLSGTVERQDGLETLLFDWLGPISFFSKKTYTTKIKVDIYKLHLDYPPLIMLKHNKKRPDPVANMTLLVNMKSRLDEVVKTLQVLVDHPFPRQTLLLSDRVAHLDMLIKATNILYPKISKGKLVGGMKLEAQAEAKTHQWVFTTFKKSKEALDMPNLSVLVLLTPEKNVYQTVCRIIRSITFTHEPWIIDFQDPWGSFMGRFKQRIKFFQKENYDIQFHNNTLSKEVEEMETSEDEEEDKPHVEPVCRF